MLKRLTQQLIDHRCRRLTGEVLHRHAEELRQRPQRLRARILAPARDQV
jgi:hypothetical protein